MASACHICEAEGRVGAEGYFECADCGELTCPECKSFGVARSTDHCQRCRG